MRATEEISKSTTFGSGFQVLPNQAQMEMEKARPSASPLRAPLYWALKRQVFLHFLWAAGFREDGVGDGLVKFYRLVIDARGMRSGGKPIDDERSLYSADVDKLRVAVFFFY